MLWNVNYIDWNGEEYEDAESADTWEDTLAMFLRYVRNPDVRQAEVVCWMGDQRRGTVLTFDNSSTD